MLSESWIVLALILETVDESDDMLQALPDYIVEHCQSDMLRYKMILCMVLSISRTSISGISLLLRNDRLAGVMEEAKGKREEKKLYEHVLGLREEKDVERVKSSVYVDEEDRTTEEVLDGLQHVYNVYCN
ncbi:hypothetical protein PROFUN_14447 [Planoprotostelium fungivorum]|uniref:Uncharacterized protein n=1 Tax=Planoprotostelium fungivorum TaxID=1890364 RepID=A0A2P6MX90_9EUKA|nr:hypothetical protein PROFUN_14447 [Planoprotostelium fungivorum]